MRRFAFVLSAVEVLIGGGWDLYQARVRDWARRWRRCGLQFPFPLTPFPCKLLTFSSYW